jgi:hypothetical protein
MDNPLISEGVLGQTIPMVKRATGRTIPDLTGREHVCEWQHGMTDRAVNEVSIPAIKEKEMSDEIVTFAALPDRMFCIVCRAALDPVIVGGQYKVPVETGFFEYSHPIKGEGSCPYEGATFLVKLQLYEAVQVEGEMTAEQQSSVIERLQGRWRKVDSEGREP